MNNRIGSFLNKKSIAAWVFLSPSLITLAVFLYIPLVMSFGMALSDVNIFLKDFSWVGLENFRELIQDYRFWNALKNTVYFTLLVVPLGTVVSLLVALYVQRNTFTRKVLRSTYYIPVICSMTAMGIVWAVLLDPTIGMFAYWVKILGFGKLLFLKDPDMAMPLISLMTIWKTFGLNMLILVAGLQAIPSTYYEVARMNGANRFQQFMYITLPSLAPTLGFCVVTNTIGSFMVFDQTYVMTRGGPMFRTETLAQYIYVRGFSISPFRLGYASSVAVVLFLVVLVISLFLYHFFTRKEVRGI